VIRISSMKKHTIKKHAEALDLRLIAFFRSTYLPLARIAFFVVFFWFGFIKLTGMSPAGDLAEALTVKTVGIEWFDQLFKAIALLECLIGILFLFPKLVRFTIPLLALHMAIVCAPLVLLPAWTWQSFMVPTLEGQYILKNVAIIALAFGVAANTKPLLSKNS
jgi:uncharacterized membrane protein YkgB